MSRIKNFYNSAMNYLIPVALITVSTVMMVTAVATYSTGDIVFAVVGAILGNCLLQAHIEREVSQRKAEFFVDLIKVLQRADEIEITKIHRDPT